MVGSSDEEMLAVAIIVRSMLRKTKRKVMFG